jgi:phosphoribosylformylglycinamidine synthase
LVNFGLLPGFEVASAGESKAKRLVALAYNDCGNFRNDWVYLKVNPDSPCIFTKGLTQLELTVRHGEGKLFTDSATLNRMLDNHQIALQYAMPDGTPAAEIFPYNPNGSINDIAGICDPTGRIFGLMPHPEAYNHWTNHPDWTRQKELLKRKGKQMPSEITPGVRIFKNAIEYLQT